MHMQKAFNSSMYSFSIQNQRRKHHLLCILKVNMITIILVLIVIAGLLQSMQIHDTLKETRELSAEIAALHVQKDQFTLKMYGMYSNIGKGTDESQHGNRLYPA